MIGNFPCESKPISITTPSIDPENSSPSMPWILLTVADSINWKSPGSFWISFQIIPISVMRTGIQSGHLKPLPSAESRVRNTPKPALATKVPSPRKAKFRPSPPIFSEPIVTSAPTAPKLTISSSSAASVFIIRSVAVSVRNEPSVIRNVSTSNFKPLTLPFSNSRDTRTASVSGMP